MLSCPPGSAPREGSAFPGTRVCLDKFHSGLQLATFQLKLNRCLWAECCLPAQPLALENIACLLLSQKQNSLDRRAIKTWRGDTKSLLSAAGKTGGGEQGCPSDL